MVCIEWQCFGSCFICWCFFSLGYVNYLCFDFDCLVCWSWVGLVGYIEVFVWIVQWKQGFEIGGFGVWKCYDGREVWCIVVCFGVVVCVVLLGFVECVLENVVEDFSYFVFLL